MKLNRLIIDFIFLISFVFPSCVYGFSEADKLLIDDKNQSVGAIRRLGAQNNIVAFDYLVLRGKHLEIKYYAQGWLTRARVANEHSASFENLVIKHFDNRFVAAALMSELWQYKSPQLAALMLADVSELAKLRAERRKNCTAKIVRAVSFQDGGGRIDFPPISYHINSRPRTVEGWARYTSVGKTTFIWRYVCANSDVDDAGKDTDGLLLDMDGFSRNAISLRVIANTQNTDIALALSPLFRNLSLLPKPNWSSVGTSIPGVTFPTVEIPSAVIKLLLDRGNSLAFTEFSEVFTELADSLPAKPAIKDALAQLPSLFKLGCASNDSRATLLVLTVLSRVLYLKNDYEKREVLKDLIPHLGRIFPIAQIDLSAIRTEILKSLSYANTPEIEALFKQVADDNFSLRNPNADALTRWAIRQNAYPIISYLLTNGADPNAMPSTPNEPAFVILARQDSEIINVLLPKMTNLKLKGHYGTTALHAAVSTGNGQREREHLVAKLIAQGADVNSISDLGSSPLHHAANSPKTIKLLLAQKAKIEVVDTMGRTPLFSAVVSQNAETVQLLLAAGANPNREDMSANSPYTDSLTRNRPDIVALLIKFGGKKSYAQSLRISKHRMFN